MIIIYKTIGSSHWPKVKKRTPLPPPREIFIQWL